jgi:hypothetical protein
MFGHLKSLYLQTANQLVAEGDLEKAELLHDKLLEIFNPDIIPYIQPGNFVLSYYSTMQSDALLKLGTETAVEKALEMIGRMFDELKETFDWFEKCDERTIAIQAENINVCIEYLSRLDALLDDDQRLLFYDKYKQLKLTKTLTTQAAQLSAQIDFYFKKGTDAQRDLFESLSKLGQLGDFAIMTNDEILEDHVFRLLDSKINMIGAVDPQAGRMLRNHFFPIEEGLAVND